MENIVMMVYGILNRVLEGWVESGVWMCIVVNRDVGCI